MSLVLQSQAGRKLVPRFFDAPHRDIQDPPECTNCLSRLNLGRANFAEPIKLLRITFSIHGAQKNLEGKVVVGGLDLEIESLDHALMKQYPFQIQVLSRSINGENTCEEISSVDNPGRLTVTRIPDFGRYTQQVIAEVRRYVKKNRVDIIHLHSISTAASRSLIGELNRLKIPYVLTNHYWYQARPSRSVKIFPKISVAMPGITRLIKREGIFKAAWILGAEVVNRIRVKIKNPKFIAQKTNGYLGSSLTAVSGDSAKVYCKEPSMIIGSPIDTEFFRKENVTAEDKDELRVRLGLPDKRIISYHARIEPGKGQINLVNVAEHLLKTGKNFHFVIAGTVQDRAYITSIKEQIASKNLEQYFTIVNALDLKDVRTLLSISSALAFPTEYEALGRTGVEAQLMGVPVVAHAVGGIPSYITHAETGFLVEKDNTKAMAAYLGYILEVPREAEKMASKAEAFARMKFDQEEIARKYVEFVYGPVIARKKPQ